MRVSEPDEAAAAALTPRPAAEPTAAPVAVPRFRWDLDVGVPAALRVAEMLVQLLFLAWLDVPGGPALSAQLTKWDAAYYGTIASSGYPAGTVLGPDGKLVSGYEFAFYPAYPLLSGIPVHLGLSTKHGLLLTAAAAGVLAAVVVHLLTAALTGSRRAGWFAAALLGALPMAITLQMGYAESLYVAVTAGVLLAAYRRQWWTAGALALLAGLTRPSGILVPLVLPLAAVAARRGGRPVADAERRAVIGATVVGFLGSPLYWAWLWYHTGRPGTWFEVEKHGWDSRIDFGGQTLHFLHLAITSPDTTQFMGVATVVSIVGVSLGCVLAAARRQYLPIAVLCLLSAAMTLGATNYWHSKPRLLLACFPLVVLAGPALARLRTSTAVLLVTAGLAASCWFGAYALDIWPYAV